MEKQVILPQDIELTEEVKTLYKDKDGKYYLSKEGAQQKLATHFPCNCGNGIREKYRIYCDNCEPPQTPKPFKDWDGEMPLYSNAYDKYFFDLSNLEEFIAEENIKEEDLDLYLCEPNYYSEVTIDYWEDVLTEDQESLPKDIQEKLDALNEAIEKHEKPASWSPSKYRTRINVISNNELVDDVFLKCKVCGDKLDEIAIPETGQCSACFTSKA